MRVPKVCRLCMSKDNLGSIFADHSMSSEDIYQATGVQVKTDDGLPQKICTKCAEDLKHILDFREKCKNTEKQLLTIKSNSETESCDSGDIRDIKEEPLDVRRTNIEFEKTDSEDEDKVRSKDFNKQVVCKLCHRMIFKRRLKIHMAERHAELDKSRVKCDLCIEYVNTLYMNKHLQLVHKDGFVCIYCKENCSTRQGLMGHLKTCSETCRRRILYIRETISCDLCDLMLTRSQLYKHKKAEHSNQAPVSQRPPNDQKVTCDVCEMKLFSMQALKKHKQKHYTNKHYEITSIDKATPIKTKKDLLQDGKRHRGPMKYNILKMGGASKVLIKSLSEVEEKNLAKWLTQMQERGFVLDKISIFDSIENIIGDPGVPQSHLISWINDFLDKHPKIEVRETKKLEEVYSNIHVQVKRWFGNVEGYLVKNNLREVMEDPSRVFSSDERLFFTATYENKYKLVQDKSHNVLFTANAGGVLAPPMIVFAYKEVPEQVMEKIPDGWAVRRSDNGIMCCDNFYEYVKDVFSPWLDKTGVKRPVILFLNAYTSFLTYQLCSLCFQNGVELIALYPYSNDITPIELALFKPMSNLWKYAISKKGGVFPEVKEIAPLLRSVVSKVPVSTIKEGFRKAGLFPMDVNNIDIPKQATVKRYDYFRNTSNCPRRVSNEPRLQVKSKTQEDSPKLGKVSKVYLSKKQLLERKEREEKAKVKIKVEVNGDSEEERNGVVNSNRERKARKRKTKEKLKFESSDESE